MQGLISLPAGIALSFGANVGTCVTALLASIGKPREAVRVSIVHVLFNVIGVLIFLPFIGPFAKFIIGISPSPAEGLTGLQAAASVLPRQVANAHSIFNATCAVLFLPLISQIARFVYWLVPDKPLPEVEEIQPKYLSELLFHTPSLALDAARHEIKRLGKRVELMNTAMLPAVLAGNRESLQAVREMDEEVDVLYKHIVNYLAEVSKMQLNEYQTQKMMKLMAAVNDLEHIGDVIEVNLVELGEKADRHQAQRLVSEDSGKFEAYSVEIDIIEKLKRIFYHARRMAESVVELEEDQAVVEKAA